MLKVEDGKGNWRYIGDNLALTNAEAKATGAGIATKMAKVPRNGTVKLQLPLHS